MAHFFGKRGSERTLGPNVEKGCPQPEVCKSECRLAFARFTDNAFADRSAFRRGLQATAADGFINPAVSGTAIHEFLCKVKQAAEEERILGLGPVPGKVRTLVIDPGWAIMSRGGRACCYATMSQPELLALPVGEWLMEDAHIYLWFLDGELPNALALFVHWGITFKEIHAWNKIYPGGISRMGLGHYFRNNVEYILFGVRGNFQPSKPPGPSENALRPPLLVSIPRSQTNFINVFETLRIRPSVRYSNANLGMASSISTGNGQWPGRSPPKPCGRASDSPPVLFDK